MPSRLRQSQVQPCSALKQRGRTLSQTLHGLRLSAVIRALQFLELDEEITKSRRAFIHREAGPRGTQQNLDHPVPVRPCSILLKPNVAEKFNHSGAYRFSRFVGTCRLLRRD